jgi:YidC/Oxa1 family membrane protein insertase
MDFQRLLLVAVFSLSSLMLWENWQTFQHPIPVSGDTSKLPNIAPKASIEVKSAKLASLSISNAGVETIGEKITVKTDALLVEINTAGGDIRRVELLKHKDTKDISKPFVLLQQQDALTYITQTGLLSNDLPSHNDLPNHKTVYKSEISNYVLDDKATDVEVKLTAETPYALIVKYLTFHRNSNLIDVKYEIKNNGNETINSTAYFQLIRDGNPPDGESKMVPTYSGPAIFTGADKFKKIDFPTLAKENHNYSKQSNDGWAAMLQHYFVAAWIPKGAESRELYANKVESNLYSVGLKLPLPAILPGQTASVGVPLYVGPASTRLDDIAPGLGLTVDYGWLTIIASPLFVVLLFIQGWVQNWGIAIIVLTVLIKLLFFPLSAASYRSMGKMRLVAPKLEKIKQQYADDRDGLNRAMMDLYKTEKINPLGGCLPVIVQIPVFISLYWAILSSVELRHATFFGWITDLSAADPYYVLPVIMGISMLVQSRLNPTPADPLQAKLMQAMPIIFSVVFFFFPAGLVLYSVVNNLLSIAQQWYITRSQQLESAGNKSA